MQIKILEPEMKHAREHWFQGDVVTVDDAVGAGYVNAGLAEDIAGVISTGTRKNQGQELVVDPAKIIVGEG